MVVRGTVKKGKVVLSKPIKVPDGTEVEVRAIKKKAAKKKPTAKAKAKPKSLAERYAPFIGKVKGLPSDMSVNLDHYLYGLPKRQ